MRNGVLTPTLSVEWTDVLVFMTRVIVSEGERGLAITLSLSEELASVLDECSGFEMLSSCHNSVG